MLGLAMVRHFWRMEQATVNSKKEKNMATERSNTKTPPAVYLWTHHVTDDNLEKGGVIYQMRHATNLISPNIILIEIYA